MLRFRDGRIENLSDSQVEPAVEKNSGAAEFVIGHGESP